MIRRCLSKNGRPAKLVQVEKGCKDGRREDHNALVLYWMDDYMSTHTASPVWDKDERALYDAFRKLRKTQRRYEKLKVKRPDLVTANFDNLITFYVEGDADTKWLLECKAKNRGVHAWHDITFPAPVQVAVEPIVEEEPPSIPDYLHWLLAGFLPTLLPAMDRTEALESVRKFVNGLRYFVDGVIKQVLRCRGGVQRTHEFIAKHRIFHLIHGAHPPDLPASLVFTFSA